MKVLGVEIPKAYEKKTQKGTTIIAMKERNGRPRKLFSTKIRVKSLDKLVFLARYFSYNMRKEGLKIKGIEPKVLVEITRKVLNCSQATAYHYVNALYQIAMEEIPK